MSAAGRGWIGGGGGVPRPWRLVSSSLFSLRARSLSLSLSLSTLSLSLSLSHTHTFLRYQFWWVFHYINMIAFFFSYFVELCRMPKIVAGINSVNKKVLE